MIHYLLFVVYYNCLHVVSHSRNIPLTFMILSIILWALNLASGTPPVMFCSGLLTSFVYLRFYQRQTNGTRGTSAENFTFAR